MIKQAITPQQVLKIWEQILITNVLLKSRDLCEAIERLTKYYEEENQDRKEK